MTTITIRNPARAMTNFERAHTGHDPLSVWGEAGRLIEEVWERPIQWTSPVAQSLPMDLCEDEEALLIRQELPDLAEDDIDISLEKDCLTIKAVKKQDVVCEEFNPYSCEQCLGEYSRTVCLPFPVESDKISTKFLNGMLEVRVLKD